jgi:hypothetical protein
MTPEQKQFLHDVMTDAYESGIGYWAAARNRKRDSDLNYLEYEVAEAGDYDEVNRTWHRITPEVIDAAIQKILSGKVQIRRDIAAQFVGYPGNIDNCDYDAEGADCAVQIAAFGEIVFG